MNPMSKTLVYVGLAVVFVSLAIWKGSPAPELNPEELGIVGESFFPEFTEPNTATGIRVVVFNEQTAEVKPFEVKLTDGQWLIPSHYNYPADGQDQLEKTATSLVAVERGGVAGTSELDYERLGVVDPLLDDASKIKGRGERLTLTRDGETLLDLIIGKQVEDRDGFYYVRRPDEKLTYITKLEVDLSTQFQDWIEADLMQLNTTDLREILIKDYSIDEASQRILVKGVLDLKREDASSSWKLVDLDEAKEELKTATMNEIIRAVDELKIVGVRPKPDGLSANLKLDGSVTATNLTSFDLSSRGFFLVPNEKGGAELYSNEGDMEVVTSEGVQYTLRFGEVFTGSEFDIEVGVAQKPETEEPKPAESAEISPDADLNQSRYLFISVAFNQEALGSEPVKPTAPAETIESKETAAPDTENKVEASTESAAGTAEEEETNTEAKTDTPATDPQKEYEAALKKYETELAAYQEKVVAGQKKVDELNARFADWYYVIDADSFNQLNKGRADLVEAKAEEKPANPGDGPSLTPPAGTSTGAAENKPDMKAEEKATPSSETSPEKTPADTKPVSTKPQTDETEKPATEKPVTEPKAADEPATGDNPAEKQSPAAENSAN